MAECAAQPDEPLLKRWPVAMTSAISATAKSSSARVQAFVVGQENSSGAQNSGSDSGSAFGDAKKSKKHSGPRKRRPKKKVDAVTAGADNDGDKREVQQAASPVRPTAVAAAHDHNAQAAPVSEAQAATNADDDDIEALLQKELVLGLDDGVEKQSPQQESVSCSSPLCATGAGYHEQQQQKQRQQSEVDAAGRVAYMSPSRPHFAANSHRLHPGARAHKRQYRNHAAANAVSELYYHTPQPPSLPRSPPQPPLPAAAPPQISELSREQDDRSYWTKWVIEAAEKERARRLNVLKQLQQEEEEEIQRRRKWAIEAIEREQEAMMREMFLDNMKNTQWFQSTISRLAEDYEVVCPNSWFGCMFSCMLKDLETHLESCVYRQVPDTLDQAGEDSLGVDFYSYDVVCPNAVLGCNEICSRENLAEHLASCPVNGISREKEWEERLEGRRNVLLATEEERARRMSEQQMQSNSEEDETRFTFGHLQQLYEEQTAMMQVVLHDEIVDFCEQQELEARQLRPWINQAVAKVKCAIQELWGADTTQVEGYGSFATQLHGGYSDVDLVVFGVSEEESLTCQQCVSALAAHFAKSQTHEFVEISAITRASVPLLKAVVLVNVTEDTCIGSNTLTMSERVLRVPFDITFDDPRGFSHNGIASAALISTLSDHFYGLRELAFVLKYFLVKRGLNDPYVGGLSSYGLLLMIIFILQEQGALVSTVAATHKEHAGCSEDIRVITDRCCPQVESDDRQMVSNARYEVQCQKGEHVAQEIITQSLMKQQLKLESSGSSGATSNSTTGATKSKKARRMHLPSLLVDDDENEHEARPFLLGKYLMDFLQFYGNDFRQHVDTIMVSGLDSYELEMITAVSPGSGSGRSSLVSPPLPMTRLSSHSPSPPGSCASLSPPLPSPPSIACPPLPPSAFASPSMSPLSSSPPLSQEGLLMICDPLQPENNVGKSCYRVSQVCRDFSDFLSFLTALIVRGSVMTTGKKKNKKKVQQQKQKQKLVGVDSNTTPPSSTSSSHDRPASNGEPHHHVRSGSSHRILTSVFEMKTRDTRASLDLSS